MKKILARQLTLTFMLWPKKNSYKEFDNEKQFLRLENFPPPPHNFSNGPSLKSFRLLTGMGHMSNTSKQRMKIILRPVINKEPLRVTQSNKPIRVS